MKFIIFVLASVSFFTIGCGTIETTEKSGYSSYIELSEAYKDVSFDCPDFKLKPRSKHSGAPTSLVKFERFIRPEYPAVPQSQQIDISVRLEFYVNELGTIEDICVLESGGQEYDIAAMDAVLKSSLYPGEAEGKPIPMIMRIPIRFRYGY